MNYQDYDALGLAELVRTNQISAPELLQQARKRLSELNPKLNAVICPMDSLAETLANSTDKEALFCGVPFLVKDLMLPFAGFPLSNGSEAMKEYIPDSNSDLVNRFAEAGLVTFGKTNTAELGAAPLTLPRLFGETKNPWDLTLNAGGSSGGSAAAVAARIVPMAYASDGGGSIRLPASYCGIFGFKPSRGLNRYEDMSSAWGGAVTSHVTTVSVRDSAAYLDLVTGNYKPGYSTDTPPELSYLQSAGQSTPGLKIALLTETPTHTVAHPECIAAAEEAAAFCQQLGHHVETATWPFDTQELMRAFMIVVFQYTSRDVTDMARLIGVSEQQLALELNTRFMANVGKGISSEQVAQALAIWKQAANHMSAFHQRYDILLTPTVATPPLPSNALALNSLEQLVIRFLIATGLARKICSNAFLDTTINKALYLTPYTPIANITGQPAMSVPLYWSQDKLPYGVQFVAAEGKDRLLFGLAGELEAARPWRSFIPTQMETANKSPPQTNEDIQE